MITAKKITAKKNSWFEVQLIHPISNETVLEADGFEALDDVAQFVADLGSAVTGTPMSLEDLKEQIKVVE